MAVVGDIPSSLFSGLSSFWQRFFRDTVDLQSFYQASEVYLGQAYLDLLSSVLNIGIIDTPLFNREAWKLFAIREDEVFFQAGVTSAEDRYVYDMPGSIASIDFLQNTIFTPEVVLERDVNFDVLDNDGFVRFHANPFRTANTLPISGVAWRYLDIEVGNRFTDTKRTSNWYDDSVQIGDTLRLLGYAGIYLQNALVGDGSYQYVGANIIFVSSGGFASFDDTYIGNLIEITDATDTNYNGLFIIKSILVPNAVILEPTTYAPLATNPNPLTWAIRKFVPFTPRKDYAVGYIDDTYLVGPSANPYPTTFKDPLVYSIVRYKPDFVATGDALSVVPPIATDTTDGTFSVCADVGCVGYVEVVLPLAAPFAASMCIDDTPSLTPATYCWFSAEDRNSGPYLLKKFKGVNNVILDVKAADLGITGTETFLAWTLARTAPVTNLAGVRQIDYGSFIAHAYRYYGSRLVEGIDYVVDYTNGLFIPKRPISDAQVHTCSYTWMQEVVLSAMGQVEEFIDGRVKQISFWVPQVWVDRFTLYYNYGSLLNRFDVSSETYKAFLRGIMQLYMSGPTLRLIESALNVVVNLPVVKNEGEVLQSYNNGITSSGSDGEFFAAAPPLLVPMFQTMSRTFNELDVGTSIVVETAIHDINVGRFRIANIIDANTVQIEAEFGVIDEFPVDWITNIHYTKQVITDQNTYTFPYNIPIDPAIMDINNVKRLTFKAFDTMTEAFRVVDYLEDPQWYFNKEIPAALWPDTSRPRRLAATTLYENIIGPTDDARIGDPGLFIGGDDDGNIIDYSGAASLRHCVAFILFDRYLKFHMFYVQIHEDLKLTDLETSDINDLVLVVKPSYTYPYVEPAETHEDMLALFEEFDYHFKFDFGSEEALDLASNAMTIGSGYMKIGDFYHYVDFVPPISTGYTAPGGIVPPPFALPLGVGVRPINLYLDALVGGKPVKENVNYTVDYDPMSATFGTVTPIGTDFWDAGLVSYAGLGLAVTNISLGDPDTRIPFGWTPIALGGSDPGYIRKHIAALPAPCENIDRAPVLYISVGGSSYVYP